MSAMRRRLVLLVAPALAAACAHGAAAPDDRPTVYRNAKGERIILSREAIAIGGAVHPLADCSDADFHCAASEEIGFRISFPRRCPDWVWLPARDGPMLLRAMYAHGGAGSYASSGRSPFVYFWQNAYGLTMLTYDPRRDFSDRAVIDRTGTGEVYERKSGPRRYACIPPRPGPG